MTERMHDVELAPGMPDDLSLSIPLGDLRRTQAAMVTAVNTVIDLREALDDVTSRYASLYEAVERVRTSLPHSSAARRELMTAMLGESADPLSEEDDQQDQEDQYEDGLDVELHGEDLPEMSGFTLAELTYGEAGAPCPSCFCNNGHFHDCPMLL